MFSTREGVKAQELGGQWKQELGGQFGRNIQPIGRGIPEPGLLAEICVAKYVDYLPFNRQIKRFERDHDWIVHKSTIKVQDSSKKDGTHLGYQWVYGITHCFEWANGLSLNEAWAGMRLNMLSYEQIDRGGKVTRFSWGANRRLTKRSVFTIMRVGRSQWEVENETFNTLKNQAYNFGHNYGHGQEHLCSPLAHLMLLAFLTDQIAELYSKEFQVILKAAKTRVKLWFQQRALFTTQEVDSFYSIYRRLAELFGIQMVLARVCLTGELLAESGH